MERFICVACGTQFSDAPEPPPSCAVCEDPRQYLPPEGQRWTTLAALAAGLLSPLYLVTERAALLIPAGRVTGFLVSGVSGARLGRRIR